MSQLVVYKASAGSGKTFRLAAEYIKHLIANPESYKSILAVTFTNKATAEMKSRILNELFTLSNGKQNEMGKTIAKDLNLPSEVVGAKAKQALSLILHDYSRFSISTIDSFVQRVIQSLLWEIGEQGGVDIELDNQPVLEHAADNLLDSASEIDELLKWLSRMGYALLDEGKSWDVRHKLIELGKQLFSEKFRLMSREDIEKFTDKQRVNHLKDELQKLVTDIITEVKTTAQYAYDKLNEQQIAPDSFAYADNGVMGYFKKCANLDEEQNELPVPDGQRASQALNDPTGEGWVTKATQKDIPLFSSLQLVVQQVLHPTIVKLNNTVTSKNAHYISAKLILKNLENLALIGDLWTKVRELSRSEGFLLLSDSGHLLREFVKESDAPFVYEKVGTRYDVFMIDEFQDTSEVQWHNFKPLIENSLSQDFFSMIVGDVKQSIYRWRNGDWKILATEVEKDFKHYGIREIPLLENWRSLPNIIEFNNDFFIKAKNFAIAQIDIKVPETTDKILTEHLKEQINQAYKDVAQKIAKQPDNNMGYVKVNMLECESKDECDAKLSSEIPQLIQEARKNHKLNDIAILVRSKNDGQKIANMLLEHNRKEPNQSKQIAFVSQEGLQLKTSLVVRLIIAAFRLVHDSNNEIAKRVLAKELITLKKTGNQSWHDYFMASYIELEVEWLSQQITRPLQEVYEAIALRYSLFNVEGELAHLAELHEHIISLSLKGGSDVSRFLQWWDEKSDKLSLSVPDSTNAISILTIHKSKGLQFPVVIIPYANWNFRPQLTSPLLWVQTQEAPFNLLPKYPIQATQTASKSLFASEILEEEMKEIVDNINLLYVAFTRAEEELHIFVPTTVEKKPSDKVTSIAKLVKAIVPSMGMQTLPDSQIEQNEIYFSGKPSQNRTEGDTKTDADKWIMDSYPVGSNFRSIKMKMESEEFFLSSPSNRTAPLEHGKIMHELFSNIHTVNDVDKAIREAEVEGIFDKNMSANLSGKIKALLAEEPFNSWFSSKWYIKTEKTILTPSGRSYRPDRVISNGIKTIVIDFKFGTQVPQHTKQVKEYVNLLEQMNYKNIEGFLWYVDSNKVEKV